MIDGDTFLLRSETGTERIRLSCLDAPEILQRHGAESRDALSGKIAGRTVMVLSSGRPDPYGRLVGEVYVGAENVNLWLVQSGHAWVYRGFCTIPIYAAAESDARKARLGLWNDARQEAPWIFRRRQKKK